jgi:hypothetical protein
MQVRRFPLLLGLVVLSSTFLPGVFGQAVTATLVGSVSDSSRAAISGAQVSITEQQTGISTTQSTNASGNYEFTLLPQGVYSVSVTNPGFANSITKDVQVPVNTTVRVDVILKAGGISQTVTVSDTAPLLQTDRADVSAEIEAKQVADLPITTNRNFQSLESLVPGVSLPTQGFSSFYNAQNSEGFEVNGQSINGNNLQIEGVDDNQFAGQVQIYIPPAAAIQTVDVETSNYAPEFGRAAGALTNVILKSGTNSFHGSAYEYNGVSATSARTYFNTTGQLPAFTNNYFGGTIGGPIIKNRTFFFADVLRSSNASHQYLLLTVPTAAFRTGDFSASASPIYDPSTGNANGVGRQQFMGNKIPASRLQSIPLALLSLIPEPNIPGAGTTNNFQETLGYLQSSTQFDVKLDHNLSESNKLGFRYSYQHINTLQDPAFGSAGGPGGSSGFQGNGTDTTYVTAGQYTHTFSPTLFMEARLGVAHLDNTAQPSDYGSDASTQLGIPGVNVSPFTSGLVGVTISGFSSPLLGYSPSMPWLRSESHIDAVDDWIKIVGNHSIKFGGEVWVIRADLTQGQTYSPRGLYTYGVDQTALNSSSSAPTLANAFASFLLDVPSQVGRDINVGDAPWRQPLYFAFVQDTWQATPKLTLTYGLRYELYPPANPNRKGGFSQYDPTTNSLEVAGYGNIPKNLGLQVNNKNFEPRLGFAYRANPSTVVRGGFGISHASFQGIQYAYNYPVRQNIAFNSLNSYTPAINDSNVAETLAQGFPAAPQPPIPANGIIPDAPLTSSWNVVNPQYKDPYVISYNLTVEQNLGKRWVGEVSFVGNQGRQIPGNFNLNAGQIAGAGASGQPEYATFKRTAATDLILKGTNSNYNALQARLTHRYASGLVWTSAYSWQKAMGYISTTGSVSGFTFYLDYPRNYAPLSWNSVQTYAQSFVYELPFGANKAWLNQGWGSRIAGGWQLSTIAHVQSGTPLLFTASSGQLNAPGTTQVPQQIAPFHRLKGIGTQNDWFDPTAFAQPVGPVLGNMGQNVFSGPGLFSLDSSLFRTFVIHESVNFQFRMDAFNTLNHPTFSNPDTTLTDASFGQVTATSGAARTLQFAGIINF